MRTVVNGQGHDSDDAQWLGSLIEGRREGCALRWCTNGSAADDVRGNANTAGDVSNSADLF